MDLSQAQKILDCFEKSKYIYAYSGMGNEQFWLVNYYSCFRYLSACHLFSNLEKIRFKQLFVRLLFFINLPSLIVEFKQQKSFKPISFVLLSSLEREPAKKASETKPLFPQQLQLEKVTFVPIKKTHQKRRNLLR